MATRLLTVAYGPPATALLGRLVGAVRAEDPLAPVTVIAPSAAAGVTLRRRLALDLGGLVNVAVTSFPQLACALAAPALAEAQRRPLPPALARAHRRASLRGSGLVADDDVLASAATEAAVEATFAELAALDPGALDALARRGGTTGIVVAAFRTFVAALAAAGFAGPDDIHRSAREAVASGRADLAALGPVVLHLPRRLGHADVGLLDVLVAAGVDVTAVVGRTGHPAADTAADALAAQLRPLLGPDEAADALVASVPAPTELVRAPDPAEEVAVAVRRVVAAVTGAGGATPVRAERVAVVSRARDPYAGMLHERLTGAGIVHHGPAVTTSAQSVPGRVLVGLLDVAAGGFRRADVAALLRAAPLVDPASGRPVPAPYWDRLAREAGVLGGVDQWRTRLGRAADARREAVLAWSVAASSGSGVGMPAPTATDAAAAGYSAESVAGSSAGDEPGAAEVDEMVAGDHRLGALGALGRFVEDLADRLVPPRERRWTAWAAWAEGLLDAYLPAALPRRPQPGDAEDGPRAAVAAALAGMAALDGVDEPPGPERFRRVLEAELDRAEHPHGRFGHGVLVGRLVDVAGADLDLVVVLGAADGALPPRRRDDVLIPDRERLAAGGALAARGLRRDEEHRDLLAALASGRTAILTAPRADPREQRERQPAPWFLDLAGARAGRLVGTEELSELRAHPWFTDVASFEAGVLAARGAPSGRDDVDLADLLADHRTGRPVAESVVAGEHDPLARGLAAAGARRAGQFDEWSGRVGAPPGVFDRLDRPRSPTGLERYATCPFRSFLGDVLGVAAVDDPTEADLISPMDQGSLVHEVLEHFIRARLGKPPGEPWSDEERAALLDLADEVADRYEADGRTGRPLLWRVRRAQIRHQLERFLDRDEAYRAAAGVAPVAVELAFGINSTGTVDDAAGEDAAGEDEPVFVELADGRRLAFRGIIDRVDRSTDGRRLVVSDYKTGRPEGFRSIAPRGGPLDLTARGTRLQLPIYALAARSRFPGADSVEARYWFVGARGEGTTIGGEYDDAADRRFRDVVTTVVDGIEAGSFPANPGGEDYRFGAWTHDNCSWCEFDRVCPTTRGEAWVRIRRAPELSSYVALAEEQLRAGDDA